MSTETLPRYAYLAAQARTSLEPDYKRKHAIKILQTAILRAPVSVTFTALKHELTILMREAYECAAHDLEHRQNAIGCLYGAERVLYGLEAMRVSDTHKVLREAVEHAHSILSAENSAEIDTLIDLAVKTAEFLETL